MVVFGGATDELITFSDVWVLSLPAVGEGAWTQLAPSGSLPPARYSHSAIYDGANQRMIVFGGYVSFGADSGPDNSVYALSLPPASGDSTWTTFSPAGTLPAARYQHSAIYDSANQQMIIFGGACSSGLVNQLPPRRCLVAHPPGRRRWCMMQLTPAGAYPDGRVQHDAIYDSVNQQMIVFGGQNSSGSLGALTLALPACL